MISKLLDLAMLWEYIPVERNPMQLVKVKGSAKRAKDIQVVTPEQFKAFVAALPEPYSIMVLVCGCLGLRVSEVLGLKWGDLDFTHRTLSIRQVFTHGQVQAVAKTEASGKEIPLHPALAAVLQNWRGRRAHETSWVFSNPKTLAGGAAHTIRGCHAVSRSVH